MTKKPTQIETELETTETTESTEVTSIQWSSIKPTLDNLDVDGLKEVIEYCQDKIDELQRHEVEALEAEMRAIQDKLMALKGHKTTLRTEGKERSKMEKVVVNPDNPSEVYRNGRTPDWLSALMAKTGKTVSELRIAMSA